jgi:hypothetical protein
MKTRIDVFMVFAAFLFFAIICGLSSLDTISVILHHDTPNFPPNSPRPGTSLPHDQFSDGEVPGRSGQKNSALETVPTPLNDSAIYRDSGKTEPIPAEKTVLFSGL